MTQMPPSYPSGPPGVGGVRPHRGTMILIFGIIGIVCCVIFGILAWVMGNSDLQAMAAGQMDRSGEGLTKAGKICGMISVALVILSIVLNVIWMIFFGGMLFSMPGAGGQNP